MGNRSIILTAIILMPFWVPEPDCQSPGNSILDPLERHGGLPPCTVGAAIMEDNEG